MGYGINKYLTYLTYLKKCLFSLIYSGDNCCKGCGELIETNEILCKSCMLKIYLCDEPLKFNHNGEEFSCFSASYYSSVIKELILKLKYKQDFQCGYILAVYMSQVIKKNNIEFDLITYVPMDKEREKIRGYNQSEILAYNLCEIFNCEMINTLKKIKTSRDQIGLSGYERWNNIEGTFKVVNMKKIKGKKILLIDDVVTTGATVFNCAKELKKYEIKEIRVLTAAKTKL